MAFNGQDIVPMPVPKNHGFSHELLLPNNFGNQGNNISVNIANLGSFTYNQEVPLPTPPKDLPPPSTPMPCVNDGYVRELTSEQCQEALIAWVKKSCCTASGPAKGTQVNRVFNYNAYEYMLYTFTEKRSLVSKFASCRSGERIDSVSNGPSPDPWSLQCLPNEKYKDHTKEIILPHTDTLQPCFRCNSFGQLRCSSCNGHGEVTCMSCNGTGHVTITNQDGTQRRTICSLCSSRGKTRCMRCSGNGALTCDHCVGSQWLKWYLIMNIILSKNNLMEFFSEKTELPDVLLTTAQGGILKMDEGPQILPIDDCSNEEVNRKSAKLLELAAQALSNEKQLSQKHILKRISCTKCTANYKEKEFKFWVMGITNEVYCPEYPGLKCCGCCCVCS